MEKKYEALKLEILEFDNKDVITASPYNQGEGQDGGENED